MRWRPAITVLAWLFATAMVVYAAVWLYATRFPPGGAPPSPSAGRAFAIQLLLVYPVPFVLVGLPVLLLRTPDRNAWLLALFFGGFVAGAPLPPVVPDPVRGFMSGFQVLLSGLLPAVTLFFFSVFPGPTALDRRAPRLKWAWLAIGLAGAVPSALAVAAAGSTAPLVELARRAPRAASVSSAVYSFGFTLGIVSLLWNAFRAPDDDVRRKGRVLVWGTLLGVLPAIALQAGALLLHRPVPAFPFWVWAPAVIALSLMPLAFGYAVLKHRVLEVPVLLRRSARYLLVQRGAVGLLIALSLGATLLAAEWLAVPLGTERASIPVGFTLGAGFGTVLAWGAARLHRRVRERIDRAFFRRAYDARLVLQSLASRIRGAQSRAEVASLLEEQIREALLPRSLAVYLEGDDGRLHVAAAPDLDLPGDLEPPSVFRGRARSADPADDEVREAGAFEPFRRLGPECLVPLTGRDGRLLGLIVLGPRLSEEPYASEDRRLLESVAGQAAVVIEGIRLAEEMAERLESERRTEHELSLAGQVQRRLLPQTPPRLETLEVVGGCLQARAVGGDYYDFLDLGPGQLGIVLADVSGKGFSAALLMASLQASLRSRSAEAASSLAHQLEEINHLLYEASQTHHYATLFVGVYDDGMRQLHYANCGHNPPILLREDGGVDRLMPTAMVVGLIEPWECETAEVSLEPGDTLVLFTDGVTDALTDQGEEFGEDRLLEALRAHVAKPPAELLGAIVETVRRFSGSEQEDDLTLVVGRARTGSIS